MNEKAQQKFCLCDTVVVLEAAVNRCEKHGAYSTNAT